jgi:hypothetical protein
MVMASRLPRPTRAVLGIGLVLAVFLSLAAAADATGRPAAGATALGTVTSVVTDATGHPLKGICVHGLPIRRPPAHGFPSTNSAGVYSDKVRPGRYFIYFSPRSFAFGCSNNRNWLAQWHTDGKFPFKPAPIEVRAGTLSGSTRSLCSGARSPAGSPGAATGF